MGLMIICDQRKVNVSTQSRDSFEGERRFRQCLVSAVSLLLDKITTVWNKLLHPHSDPFSWDPPSLNRTLHVEGLPMRKKKGNQ